MKIYPWLFPKHKPEIENRFIDKLGNLAIEAGVSIVTVGFMAGLTWLLAIAF